MDDLRFQQLNEMRRYWDEIARGGPATRGGLDPELAATIRRVHALQDAPPPDPAYGIRLRERLMHATSIPLPLTDPRAIPRINGQPAPPARRALLPPLPVSQGRWALAQLATALFVLFVLFGSFLAFGPGRSGRWEDAPAFLPAIGGTPVALETVVTETLFDAILENLPTGDGDAVLNRWTMRPGDRALVLPTEEGPRFFLVESGELSATEAGTTHRLAAGDVYIPALDQEVAFRLSGSADAVLFRGYLAKDWVSSSMTHRNEWLIDESTNSMPGGSGRLVVERLALPPGGALPPVTGDLTWTGLESGTLGLTLEGDVLAPGWTSGEERTLRVGSVWPLILDETRMTLRNAGAEPLVLYRMTLTPDAGEASAAGTPIP